MAEKNTLSILETIKKKMNKLDQKADKTSKISEVNDEFQYISSGPRKEGAARPQEQKPVNKQERVLDDFNLDDLSGFRL